MTSRAPQDWGDKRNGYGSTDYTLGASRRYVRLFVYGLPVILVLLLIGTMLGVFAPLIISPVEVTGVMGEPYTKVNDGLELHFFEVIEAVPPEYNGMLFQFSGLEQQGQLHKGDEVSIKGRKVRFLYGQPAVVLVDAIETSP